MTKRSYLVSLAALASALALATASWLASRALRTPLRVARRAVFGATTTETYASHRPTAIPDDTPEEEDSADPSSVVRWCADGLEAVPGGGCYAAPAGTLHSPLPLILYLHGIFEEGPLEDEERDRQHRLASRATVRGFAVLALLGGKGACTTTPELATMVCWPSNERTADKGPSFVETWRPAIREAAKRHPIEARYVLGFSNGGYFAGLVAERGLYEANAFVVAHAGAVEPVEALKSKPPILLISADDDLSQQEMIRLDDELTSEAWPHEHYVREGGHALSDSDIDAALTFFERTRTESLPLQPPLSTRAPRARLTGHDALP